MKVYEDRKKAVLDAVRDGNYKADDLLKLVTQDDIDLMIADGFLRSSRESGEVWYTTTTKGDRYHYPAQRSCRPRGDKIQVRAQYEDGVIRLMFTPEDRYASIAEVMEYLTFEQAEELVKRLTDIMAAAKVLYED